MCTEIGRNDAAMLANRLADEPGSWVPILGMEVSVDNDGSADNDGDVSAGRKRKELIQHLFQEVFQGNEEIPEEQALLHEAVEGENMKSLEQWLFGDIWDGVTIRDELGNRQLASREKLARRQRTADQINIEAAMYDGMVDVGKILQIFPGLVLTTCQDETVEAFMEYERAMHVTEDVCDPYSMLTSPKWEKRLEGILKGSSAGNSEQARVLVKLGGTCAKSQRLLLTAWDYEACYPEAGGENAPYTVKFLKELFKQKNLLFIGVEGKRNRDDTVELELPAPIGRLLNPREADEDKQGQRERFWLNLTAPEDINTFWEEVSKEYWRKISSKGGSKKNRRDRQDSDRKEEIEEFRSLYIRRPFSDIAPEEKKILESSIQRLKTSGYPGRKNIQLLAMIANNVADFYDLEKLLSDLQTSGEESAESGLIRLVKLRLSDESMKLYDLLRHYGKGFPSGLFELLAEDEAELEKMRKEAIQLANSGICVKGEHRKYIYRRLDFADSVMLTAAEGYELMKQRLKQEMESWNREINDSYLFVSDVLIDGQVNEKEVREKYERMCKRLYEIFEAKSDGYLHFRSLAETEKARIVELMEELMQESGLDYVWMPRLIYYLFSEAFLVSLPDAQGEAGAQDEAGVHDEAGDRDKTKTLADKILGRLEQPKQEPSAAPTDKKGLLYSKVLLCMALAIQQSQKRYRDGIEEVLKYCDKAKSTCEELKKLNLADLDSVRAEIEIHLLKSRIYGRYSTIAEIKRCAGEESICTEQEKLLAGMNESLQEAESLVDQYLPQYKAAIQESEFRIKHFRGEYYFKQSQLLWENRKYAEKPKEQQSEEEQDAYADAEKYYQDALKFYQKFPDKYECRKADVLRCLADLYCQKEKSAGREEASEKCFERLYEAYMIYRKNRDLHGIADVLQSMGNAQSFAQTKGSSAQTDKRSSLCFYQVSKELYQYLKDRWSQHVVQQFQQGGEKQICKSGSMSSDP